MEFQIDREIFHQMMRRIHGVGGREGLSDAMLITMRETALKLSQESAAQNGAPITVTL